MDDDRSSSVQRFPCTAGGRIARGRRRLTLLLLGLAVLMALVGLVCLGQGRPGPAVLTFVVAFVLWLAWRMSRDLDLLWLEIDGPRLVIQMRRKRETVPLAGSRVRALDREEHQHLERLTASGLFTLPAGGFESTLLGEFDLYASNLDNPVLIDAGETRVIVTPDDPDRFVDRVAHW